MLRNVAISIGLHAALAVVAYFGLPSFRNAIEMQDIPVTVEIVTVSDVTNLPTKPKEAPAPKKADTPPPPPPKPPKAPPGPQGSVEDTPPPPPPPAPAEEKVAVLMPTETQPKKEAKPKPKPEPKEEPKAAPKTPRKAAPVPPRKPKAPDQFASVLKTLEELQSQPQAKPDKKAEPAAPDFSQLMENALESDKLRTDIGPDLTISEIDLVRQQIQRCWALPAGAKGAHEMIVTLRLAMNPDGTIQSARIEQAQRMATDPFFRTMGESVIRAVRKPGCEKFALPPEKYARWQTLTLDFNPKEMFGL